MLSYLLSFPKKMKQMTVGCLKATAVEIQMIKGSNLNKKYVIVVLALCNSHQLLPTYNFPTKFQVLI